MRRSVPALALAGVLACTPGAQGADDVPAGGKGSGKGSGKPKNGRTGNVTETCERALARIAAQEWDDWSGLPGDCAPADVEKVFGEVSETSGRGHIGTKNVTTEFKTAEHEGLGRRIKVWLREDRVVLIEVPYPGVEDAHRHFTDKLGDPAARLDYYQRTLLYSESAYLYPDRGLALLYNPDRSALISIYLFAPTTLATYERTLHHPVSPARRLR